MSVAVDNTGKTIGGTNVTSLTLTSFAVGSGANRFLWVGASQYKASDLQPTATFNGTTCTVYDSNTVVESPGTRRVTVFKQLAPANTSASVVVTWSAACDEAVIGATSWTGVDQTTPLGTSVKSSSTTATSLSVTVSSSTGNMVHDTISADAAAAASLVANQTKRWDSIAAASTSEGAGQSAAGASSVTMTWTGINQGAGGKSCMLGADIHAAGGTTTTNHFLLLLGVGI